MDRFGSGVGSERTRMRPSWRGRGRPSAAVHTLTLWPQFASAVATFLTCSSTPPTFGAYELVIRAILRVAALSRRYVSGRFETQANRIAKRFAGEREEGARDESDAGHHGVGCADGSSGL